MQPHYRTYMQQAPQRSPHAPNQRRGGIGPIMPAVPNHSAPLSQVQTTHQQVQTQTNGAAKRRGRKPTDKNMPDGVEECIIDPDAVQRYKDLREVERWLDATTTRKRIDVSESINRCHTKRYKTLRVWICNSVEDQVWQGCDLNVDAFDFSPNMEASYRVKIEGRVLHDDEDGHPPQPGHGQDPMVASLASGKLQPDEHVTSDQTSRQAKPAQYPFSHFFRALSVDFDRSRFRNGAEQNIEWKKPDSVNKGHASGNAATAAEFDEITFKRNGDENTNITINLYRHESPERYELTPQLADVVDMAEATQSEAVMGLWEYIRSRGLQEDEEKRNFRCDDLLKRVVGRGDVGYIPMLGEYVAQHLRPLAPISLPYTIRVDQEFHRDPQPTVYDVRVLVDDPIRVELQALINNSQHLNMLRDVNTLDEQLARLIQAIAVSKAKYSFFTALEEDPATFTRHWLSSQKRDLEIILGEASRGGSESSYGDQWRKGGLRSVWTTQDARETVNVLLSRQR